MVIIIQSLDQFSSAGYFRTPCRQSQWRWSTVDGLCSMWVTLEVEEVRLHFTPEGA